MTGQDFVAAHPAQPTDDVETKKRSSSQNDEEGYPPKEVAPEEPHDPFGDEVGAAVQYKTMKWWQGAMGM